MRLFQNIRFKNALMVVSFLLIATPLIIQGIIYYFNSVKEVNLLAEEQITQQGATLSKLIESVATAEENQLKSNLMAAKVMVLGDELDHVVAINDQEKTTLFTINQTTKNGENLTIPSLSIDGKKALFNSDFVDKIKITIECDSTIFQMIPGGMLRISTTLLDDKGQKAVGTYIPSDSPVYQAVSQGNAYIGRAMILGKWFSTAYEPLKDPAGKIVGAIFIGHSEDRFQEHLKDELASLVIGKTGYVFILDDKGNYILSAKRERDGENIWETKDSDGKFVMQDIIAKAKNLKEGEIGLTAYNWKNIGETKPRIKTASYSYYAPWSWIIAASAYNDDYAAITNQVKNTTGIVIAISLLLGLIIIFIFARSVANPLMLIQEIVAKVKAGDKNIRINQHSNIKELQDVSGDFDTILESLSDKQFIDDSFLMGLADPALKTDNNLIVTQANDSLLKSAGYSREQVVGKMTCAELLKTPLCGTDKCPIMSCMKNKNSMAIENTASNREGEQFPIREACGHLQDSKGEVVGGFQVLQDLSALHSLVKTVEDVSAGDLTVSVEDDHKARVDSTGSLANAVDKMIKKIKNLVQGVVQQASSTAAAAQQLSASSQQVNASMQQVSSTIQQVASGAQDVSKNAGLVQETTTKTEQSAAKGGDAALLVSQKMGSINISTKENSTKIKALGDMSNKISNIVKTISSISEQTNLLALNAAIEAARAGEAGRGFAVVADEVRKLAEESGDATEQISTLIENIQAEINASVKSMEKSALEVEDGTISVQDAVKSFEAIPVLVENISRSISNMTAVAEQNAVGSDQLASSVQQVTSAMQQVSSAAQTLSGGADELRAMISKFKIDDNSHIESDDADDEDGESEDEEEVAPAPKKKVTRAKKAA